MNDWERAVDALEEWVRRIAAAATEDLNPPDLPPGPVPTELRLRLQVLVVSMRAATAGLLTQRDELSRKHAYGAA